MSEHRVTIELEVIVDPQEDVPERVVLDHVRDDIINEIDGVDYGGQHEPYAHWATSRVVSYEETPQEQDVE